MDRRTDRLTDIASNDIRYFFHERKKTLKIYTNLWKSDSYQIRTLSPKSQFSHSSLDLKMVKRTHGEQFSLPTSDQKKTILDIGVQMVTMDWLRYRQTGGTGFRQFVQSVSCDIFVKLYNDYRNYGVIVLTEWHANFYKQQYPNDSTI